jgi:hypothetical protein
MFILYLNDMRSAHVEDIHPICHAETREALLSFVEGETVPSYTDGRWGKSFRKGGPLEWYNHLGIFGRIEQAITLEEYLNINRMMEKWNAMIGVLPSLEKLKEKTP